MDSSCFIDVVDKLGLASRIAQYLAYVEGAWIWSQSHLTKPAEAFELRRSNGWDPSTEFASVSYLKINEI